MASFTTMLQGVKEPVKVVAVHRPSEEFTFVITINGEDYASYVMKGSYITCLQAIVLRLIEEGVVKDLPFYHKLK